METLENTQQEPTMEQSKWPENPWLSIWIQPRATIRAIVDVDPKRHVILLAALTGFTEALDRASARDLGDIIPLFGILIVAAALGPLLGIASVYFSSALLSWIGRLFGGKASDIEVRTAVAWSSVPLICSMLLWIPKLGLYGTEIFTSDTQFIDKLPWGLLIISILEIIIAIWALIIFIKCLGEVHEFSAWKALLVSIIPGLAIAILVFGCTLAAGGL